MMRLAERFEVAKSFARIALSVAQVSAVRASKGLRDAAEDAIADSLEDDASLPSRVAALSRVARAAAGAAVHVAKQRAESVARGVGEEPGDPLSAVGAPAADEA